MECFRLLQKRAGGVHFVTIVNALFLAHIGLDGEEIRTVFGGEERGRPTCFSYLRAHANELESDFLFISHRVFDFLRDSLVHIHKMPSAKAGIAPHFAAHGKLFHV